jgi:hypothetical protein
LKPATTAKWWQGHHAEMKPKNLPPTALQP